MCVCISYSCIRPSTKSSLIHDFKNLYLIPLHVDVHPNHGRVSLLSRGCHFGIILICYRIRHRSYGTIAVVRGEPVMRTCDLCELTLLVLRTSSDIYCIIHIFLDLDYSLCGSEKHTDHARRSIHKWSGGIGFSERCWRYCWGSLCAQQAASAHDDLYTKPFVSQLSIKARAIKNHETS